MSLEKYRKVQKYTVPIEKEVIKIVKDGNEIIVTISYKMKFNYSARFILLSTWMITWMIMSVWTGKV